MQPRDRNAPKRLRELLEAHGEPTETLQLLEQVLYEMPLAIQMSIDLALRLSCRIGRDDDSTVLMVQLLHQGLCSIRSITSNVGLMKVG